jgi:hypothetical protein
MSYYLSDNIRGTGYSIILMATHNNVRSESVIKGYGSMNPDPPERNIYRYTAIVKY